MESSSGSGAVVAAHLGRRRSAVLTAAHVVADSRYLQVQRTNDRYGGEKFRPAARRRGLAHTTRCSSGGGVP